MQNEPNAHQLLNQARQCLSRHEPERARPYLERAIQVAPETIDAYTLLSATRLKRGDLRGATQDLLDALPHVPGDLRTIAKLGHFLYLAGETVAARRCLRHPAVEHSRDGDGLMAVGLIHGMMGESQTALALLKRALAAGNDTLELRYHLGLLHEFCGKFDDARSYYETCLHKQEGFGQAMLRLARLGKRNVDNHHVDAIRTALKKLPPGASIDKACFQFALYEELDTQADYEGAWQALTAANDMMHGRFHYDARQDAELVDAILSGSQVEPMAERGHTDVPTPIFIIGLPRSGTTLLERILGNHSQITPAGELMDFFRQLRWMTNVHDQSPLDLEVLLRSTAIDYAELGTRYLTQTSWRATESAYFVDKFPFNYLLAGMIHRALPHAPILHMVRAPMDICFSNYKAMFMDHCPYSYGQRSTAAYHDQYRRLMTHWHRVMPGAIMDVSYGELVHSPQKMTEKVLAFCGLPFEETCLYMTQSDAPVTSLSSAQVREPIHTRGLGEWKHYAEHLQPMRDALSDDHG